MAEFPISEKCVVPDEWRRYVGCRFRHYKGNDYCLDGLAPHTETLEPMAVYHQLYGNGALWVRPAKMFFEEIEKDGKRFRRFAPIDG